MACEPLDTSESNERELKMACTGANDGVRLEDPWLPDVSERTFEKHFESDTVLDDAGQRGSQTVAW